MSERAERVYQNHHLDSTRWDHVRFRADDIVISTAYKAGTTWLQTIVAGLLFQDAPPPGAVTDISAWVDKRFRPLASLLEQLEAQTHRRFLKSHLALDGLPYREEVKYIMVGRDPRDVFMSLYNHYSSHTPELHARINETPGRVGPPLPHCPQDIHWLWRQWVSFGWFEWERDGWPYWSHLHHAKTWWAERRRPNILLVHFNDLKADLEGEMRRIAAFLDIAVAEAAWPRLVEAATFESMKRRAAEILPDADGAWRGGAERFLYKGTNGRWRDVLTAEDLALYRPAVERTLGPDAAAWLERGRVDAARHATIGAAPGPEGDRPCPEGQSSMIEVQPLTDVECKLGEGPLWDPVSQVLYWVDSHGPTIWSHDERSGETRRWALPGKSIGSMALREAGGAVLAREDGFYGFDFDSGRCTPISRPEQGAAGLRFNDGKVDRQGRFLAGSMVLGFEERRGALYRLDADRHCERIETRLVCANGPCWSPDGATFYFTHGTRPCIYAYDYDAQAGLLSNRRVFVSTEPWSAWPDGATVDAEGFVWSALFGASSVARFSPDGRLDRRVGLPCERVSSVMFGGENLDVLYVTTIGESIDGREDPSALAGRLFSIRGLRVRGLPEPRFRG